MLGGIVNPDGTDGDAPLEREREDDRRRRTRAALPVLGICLGAQLIAQALDGSAERLPAARARSAGCAIEFDEAAQQR